jgi:hypothetical protein
MSWRSSTETGTRSPARPPQSCRRNPVADAPCSWKSTPTSGNCWLAFPAGLAAKARRPRGIATVSVCRVGNRCRQSLHARRCSCNRPASSSDSPNPRRLRKSSRDGQRVSVGVGFFAEIPTVNAVRNHTTKEREHLLIGMRSRAERDICSDKSEIQLPRTRSGHDRS